jgi:iron complex outermembrane recepter protein
MKKILLCCIIFLSARLNAQQTIIKGTVTDVTSKEPLIGANIVVKGKLTGTTSDSKGNFTLNTGIPLPFTLIVSSIGYQPQEIVVAVEEQSLILQLDIRNELVDEVVVSASRVMESMLKSPVSIEKIDATAMRNTASFNYYESLQNVKSLEMVTSGLTYTQINTRGFNDTGNARFLQLVDGVDNQTPGLSFAVGNLFGSSDLDIESIELIPGSASALYGPVAFNGVLMIRTKDPFQHQGLSLQGRTGMNHFNENFTEPRPLYDVSFRYAKAFHNLAFKVNGSYFRGTDWYATNYTDVDPGTPLEERGLNNPARNALNIYGDDEARVIDGVGRVSRTGYEERHLLDYNVYSLKLNSALHYRLAENTELIYQYNYNRGRAAYTGSNRFQLNNFVFQQHKVEMKGTQYFIRAYVNIEDSKNSYNGKALGQLINKTWVLDLSGNIVNAENADDMWFTRYETAFSGAVVGITPGSHNTARAFADQGRLEPGTTAFNHKKDSLIGVQGISGAGILSQSKLYHAEGQYDFSNNIGIVDILVGGNFRLYDMFTNGTLFDDINHKIIIKEGGAFVQLSKRFLNEKLKLTGSLRYDRNQNFDGRFTPRASIVYTAGENHNFRASYQSGFRNPTPGDQYIKLNAGSITILGGVPDNSKGMNVYENTFTTTSLESFFEGFSMAINNGSSSQEAIMAAKDLLVKSDVAYIKPERVQTFEIGYRSLIAKMLLVDVSFYFSSYEDFILNQVVMQPENQVLGTDGNINPAAAEDLLSGNSHLYQLYTNTEDRVTSQGATVGISWLLPLKYSLDAHITWAEFNLLDANPEDIPAFNTPRFSTAISLGNQTVTKKIGFALVWRWQESFDWTGTFNQLRPGKIRAYSTVDAQLTYRLVPVKTLIKIGGSNILNNKVYQAYGSPSIGAVWYVSLLFDQFLN